MLYQKSQNSHMKFKDSLILNDQSMCVSIEVDNIVALVKEHSQQSDSRMFRCHSYIALCLFADFVDH